MAKTPITTFAHNSLLPYSGATQKFLDARLAGELAKAAALSGPLEEDQAMVLGELLKEVVNPSAPCYGKKSISVPTLDFLGDSVNILIGIVTELEAEVLNEYVQYADASDELVQALHFNIIGVLRDGIIEFFYLRKDGDPVKVEESDIQGQTTYPVVGIRTAVIPVGGNFAPRCRPYRSTLDIYAFTESGSAGEYIFRTPRAFGIQPFIVPWSFYVREHVFWDPNRGSGIAQIQRSGIQKVGDFSWTNYANTQSNAEITGLSIDGYTGVTADGSDIANAFTEYGEAVICLSQLYDFNTVMFTGPEGELTVGMSQGDIKITTSNYDNTPTLQVVQNIEDLKSLRIYTLLQPSY